MVFCVLHHTNLPTSYPYPFQVVFNKEDTNHASHEEVLEAVELTGKDVERYGVWYMVYDIWSFTYFRMLSICSFLAL
ncbi:hypothetical protein EON63_18180 [archaeon]|nr:MAG: hypothetical protein EON63_18180 [archaeon]